LNKRDALWTAAAAALLTAAFPPFPFGGLAMAALVPFFFVVSGKRPASAFRWGYALGFLVTAGTLYWIAWPSFAGFLGALLYLPLAFGIFAWGTAFAVGAFGEKAWVVAPVLWTAMEFLSWLGPLAFPWNSLSSTLSRFPVLLQHAALVGAPGVSFWIVVVNVLVYGCIWQGIETKRGRLLAVAAMAAFGIPWIYGTLVLSRPSDSGDPIKVSLVQGNIDPYKKWTPAFIDSNFIVYDRLTRTLKPLQPDLVVWPETATPCYLRQRFVYLNWVKFLCDSLGTPICTGSPDTEPNGSGTQRTYNAAFLISPASWDILRYYKMRLVPFSERVPFADVFPWFNRLAMSLSPDVGDYSPGDSVSVFPFRAGRSGKTYRFSPVICFESVFPVSVGECVRRGAEFIVVITNDGWFGNTSGPRQHAWIAVLRAVETRRWIVRCANTGISEFVDPYGRVRLVTRYNQEAVLTGAVHPRNDRTFFVISVRWLAGGCLAAAAAILIASVVRTRRTGRLPLRRRRNS
jgi:apolipoprotein N-acyltransferase